MPSQQVKDARRWSRAAWRVVSGFRQSATPHAREHAERAEVAAAQARDAERRGDAAALENAWNACRDAYHAARAVQHGESPPPSAHKLEPVVNAVARRVERQHQAALMRARLTNARQQARSLAVGIYRHPGDRQREQMFEEFIVQAELDDAERQLALNFAQRLHTKEAVEKGRRNQKLYHKKRRIRAEELCQAKEQRCSAAPPAAPLPAVSCQGPVSRCMARAQRHAVAPLAPARQPVHTNFPGAPPSVLMTLSQLAHPPVAASWAGWLEINGAAVDRLKRPQVDDVDEPRLVKRQRVL